MSAALSAIPPCPSATKIKVDATGEAVSSLTPELVVALCGPIGSPLHSAATQIANTLGEFGYRTDIVRLSTLIRLNSTKVGLGVDESSKFSEIRSLIQIGDALRERYGRDVLAKLAIAKIGGDRQNSFGQFDDVVSESSTEPSRRIRSQRVCHIIDSVKNTAELDLLRLIYGDALFAVGVFSPLELRIENLERSGKLTRVEIDQLIDTDSGEEFAHGQSVRDTFHRCDFFLRVDHAAVGPSEPKAVGQLNERIRRFFDLIFRTNVVTPTPEEAAMYAAASAARNSACLSRQVGAAVTSAAGELLAVGWNDVPQSGGGLYGMKPVNSRLLGVYSGTSVDDQRCFARAGERCHNDAEKSVIAEKVVDSLISVSVASTPS